MDISQQFDSIVKSIVDDIQVKVSDQVTNLVRSELKKQLDGFDYSAIISGLADAKLEEKLNSFTFEPEAVQKRIIAATNTITAQIESNAKQQIDIAISNNVAKVDFNSQMAVAMSTVLNNKIQDIYFPVDSIPAKSIKQKDLRITGDQINGGIIANFGSTGIDDKATGCVVTILDHAVVVENNLVTLDLTVQGNLDVKGAVPEDSVFYKQLTSSVTKTVQDGLDTELFSGFSDTIFKKIATEGLDLNKITVNKEPVIEGTRIGYSITESNLQKLGLLKELQVQGETLLAESLYVGNKRVGVNTLEPSAALAVWDEEIEVTVSKDKTNTARIGTPRNQKLIIGSNRNDNIILHEDGLTQIDSLQVGSMRISASVTPPSFASQRGHIVFNANPNPGGPMGWVCLGSANWANFGIID